MNKATQSALDSWGVVVAEFESIVAIADSGFSPETIAQARQFLDFASTHCSIPHGVCKGYWPTIRVSWETPAFEVEIFSDRLETYRFRDGTTDIKHWDHAPGAPYIADLISELSAKE